MFQSFILNNFFHCINDRSIDVFFDVDWKMNLQFSNEFNEVLRELLENKRSFLFQFLDLRQNYFHLLSHALKWDKILVAKFWICILELLQPIIEGDFKYWVEELDNLRVHLQWILIVESIGHVLNFLEIWYVPSSMFLSIIKKSLDFLTLSLHIFIVWIDLKCIKVVLV